VIATHGHKHQVGEACAGLLMLSRMLPALIDAESLQDLVEKSPDLFVASTADLMKVSHDVFVGRTDEQLTYQDLRRFVAAICRKALELLENGR
jgi:hypothetical protein